MKYTSSVTKFVVAWSVALPLMALALIMLPLALLIALLHAVVVFVIDTIDETGAAICRWAEKP